MSDREDRMREYLKDREKRQYEMKVVKEEKDEIEEMFKRRERAQVTYTVEQIHEELPDWDYWTDKEVLYMKYCEMENGEFDWKPVYRVTDYTRKIDTHAGSNDYWTGSIEKRDNEIEDRVTATGDTRDELIRNLREVRSTEQSEEERNELEGTVHKVINRAAELRAIAAWVAKK